MRPEPGAALFKVEDAILQNPIPIGVHTLV